MFIMSRDCDGQVLFVSYIICKNMADCAYFHIFSLTVGTAKKARRRRREKRKGSNESQFLATQTDYSG